MLLTEQYLTQTYENTTGTYIKYIYIYMGKKEREDKMLEEDGLIRS